MISKMSFTVPAVRDCLNRNGTVITVRGYEYTTQTATVPELGNIRVKRQRVCEVGRPEDLAGFLPLSGFTTMATWWRQIERFCKEGQAKILYRVELDREQQRLSQEEEEKDRTHYQREFEIANAHSNKAEIAETTHPLDIRDESTDPALVDLQPYKDAAEAEAAQRATKAIAAKRARLRKQYGEQEGRT